MVSDGKITNIERVESPKTGKSISNLCQKGIVYAKYPYLDHPDRLKYPLKRVGERGEGKFERISWEQAMDEIAEKLNKIREEMGSEAVLVNNFASSFPGVFTSLHMPLTWRFVHSFGASLVPWIPVDVSLVWNNIFNMGTFFGYTAYDSRRLKNAKYILIWGSSPLGWNAASDTSQAFMEAKENGAKLVTIGAVFDSTTALSDEFIPIKPATDIYLAMAMAHVIFRDKLLDEEFLAAHSVAPFIVRNDNGKFLREADIVPGGDPNNYVVWNKSPAVPVAVAPHSEIPENVVPDLFAEPVINGISCSTALVKIRAEAQKWSPEVQEEYTGVPAEAVERITHEYVETENSVLDLYTGMRYQNGGPACRAVAMLPILSGKLGKDETLGFTFGAQLGEYPLTFNDVPLIFPDGDPGQAKGKFPLTFAEMFENGFPYKALLNVMSNPVQTWPNRDLWTQEIFPKLDLIVSYEVRLSDTAMYADYVLPDATTLERYEFAVKGGHLILCEPAVEGESDCKASAEFYAELAKRLGLGQYFDKTQKEWLKLRLQSPDPQIAEAQPAITWERLEKEKLVPLNVPDEPYNTWANLDFPTDSGRVEIYSEHLAEAGQAVPRYFDPVIYGPESKQYPLQLYVGRHRVFMQSQFTEFPELRQIGGDKPFARLNPKDAAKYGIKDGDLVEVFNSRGQFRVPAKLTEGVRPGVVFVYLAYTAKAWDGDPPQKLMTPVGTAEREDLLLKTTHKYLRSHMPYPETMDMELHIPVAWETMWDNVCDIRKAEGGK